MRLSVFIVLGERDCGRHAGSDRTGALQRTAPGFDQAWHSSALRETGAAAHGGTPCQFCTEPRIVLRALAFLTTCATPVIIHVRCGTSEKVRTLRTASARF